MMSNDREHDVTYFLSTDAAEDSLGAAGDAEGRSNLWHVIDDRLQGRWRVMFVLGIVLAVVLAPLGYLMTEPIYESTGIIHIKPAGDPVIHTIPETEPMREYSQFVQTQAAKLLSARVLQAALDEEELRSKAWITQPNAVNILKSGLSVEAPRGSQFVNVIYEHADAREAQARLNAVLHAYEKQVDDAWSVSLTAKIEQLRRQKQNLSGQLRQLKQRLYGLPSVDAFTTIKLQPVLDQKRAQLTAVEDQLRWIEITKAVNEEEGIGPEEPLGKPSGRQLDLVDPELAQFRTDRDQKLRRVEELRQRLGPEHIVLKRAQRELEAAQRQLEEREGRALELYERAGAAVLDGREANQNLTIDQLLVKEEELLTLREGLRTDVQMLGADIQTAEELDAEIEKTRTRIDEVDSRIQDLEIELTTANRSRISIFQEGMRSVDPAKDRRKPFAAIGAMGGFGLSFALFFLLGSIDRRAYRLHQVPREGPRGLRTLGVLPDLGRTLTDPEAADMAAHCVHQIRNLIEATRPATEGGAVVAISSPYQGDGKTSIALALGFSYAAAGYHTLVVDGDLVGRGLSRQLNLGDAHGVKEAVREGAVNGEIVTLGRSPDAPPDSRTLNAMPAGLDRSITPQGIRKSDMVRLFEELRGMYDIVVVDTGPVLGSLECIPIVSAADGVVLSLRRGRQRNRLEECIDYLNSVGATCYGLVMNCAARSECYRYVSEASLAHTRALASAASRETADGPASVLVSAMHASDADTDEKRTKGHAESG